MLRVAARRLPFLCLLVVVSFLSAFLLTAFAPGDAAYAALPRGPEAYRAERARLGLDRPVLERLRERAARALVFDLGTSAQFGRPVLPLVVERATDTLLAGGTALICALLVGMPAGVAVARLRSTAARRVAAATSLIVLSLPSLVVALLLASGLSSLRAPQFLVVVLALALPASALVERLQADAYRSTLSGTYVMAARARGVPEQRAAWRHAWPLSLPAVLGVVSLVASQLVSGSLAVELVTGWPGLGRLTYDALLARDADLAAGCVAAAAALVGLATLAADLVHAAVDPRLSL